MLVPIPNYLGVTEKVCQNKKQCHQYSSSAWNYFWIYQEIDWWYQYYDRTHEIIIHQNSIGFFYVSFECNFDAKSWWISKTIFFKRFDNKVIFFLAHDWINFQTDFINDSFIFCILKLEMFWKMYCFKKDPFFLFKGT